MSPPFSAGRDSPHTRERRRAILAMAPLTAPLAPQQMERLLAASALATCRGGTVLFTAGAAPSDVFVIGTGFVQMRVRGGGLADTGEPCMHLRLCGAGDLVADREMAWLAAGAVGPQPRRQAAIVLGDPAEILALDQAVLAGLLAEDAPARARMATELSRVTEALERLADDLAGLKNLGRVRLARLLLELFDRMGQLRGEVVRLPQQFSHADIAASLSLTRRSVFDDMLALEDFGAIDHDRTGHLVLHQRARLARIASLDPSEDRESGATLWRLDVEAALAANDTLRGLELAREALLYHPRDGELRYLAVLAALRAGALAEAEKLIATYRYSTGDESERVIALIARVAKERAFAAEDRETMRAYARQSAETYHAAHRRTGGAYSALNAASMYCVGDRPEPGLALARSLIQKPTVCSGGYWAYATSAEAFFLLGDIASATGMLRRAAASGDADGGKIGTTRLQLQRLSAALGRDASSLTATFPVRKLLVCMAPPPASLWPPLDDAQWAGAFIALSDMADLAECGKLQNVAACEWVLAAPAETLFRRASAQAVLTLSRCVCHLADAAPGTISQARREAAWRRAAGLAHLAAAERGCDVAFLTQSGLIRTDRPDWAAPDALAPGQSAIVWCQATGDTPLPDLAEGLAAAEKRVSANSLTLKFSGVAEALSSAITLHGAARSRGLNVRLCLDVENLSATPLEAALLPRAQPLTRAGEIFASEAAAAELALLRKPDMKLIGVGRVRSQRRLNRMSAWVIKHASRWA